MPLGYTGWVCPHLARFCCVVWEVQCTELNTEKHKGRWMDGWVDGWIDGRMGVQRGASAVLKLFPCVSRGREPILTLLWEPRLEVDHAQACWEMPWRMRAGSIPVFRSHTHIHTSTGNLLHFVFFFTTTLTWYVCVGEWVCVCVHFWVSTRVCCLSRTFSNHGGRKKERHHVFAACEECTHTYTALLSPLPFIPCPPTVQ